ncbi:MAG: PAAR-like domain-containing protein [Polyangiaceae bacterium]
MLSASTRTSGQAIAAPDTCLTPTGTGADAPIPYVNTASHSQAVAFSTTVMIENGNALTQASSVPSTSGDEAGTDHPVTRQEARYTMGNPVVFIEQMPAITLTSLSTGNAMNASSGAVASPSAATVYFTKAGERAPGAPLSMRDLRALGAIARGGEDAVSWDGETLRVAVFTSDVGALVHRALSGLPVDRLLQIDLRGNPGGDLDAALDLASAFVGEGHVLGTLVDADGDATERRSRGPALYVNPLELIVDHTTASAAEVFVSALVALGRARVIGGPTYGKSIVQRVVAGADGLARYETIAMWTDR